MVVDFYDRVRSDVTLGPIFERRIEDWPAHLDRMVLFWRSVLRAEAAYRPVKGTPLEVHMRIAELEREHFARWLALFEETTTEIFDDWAAEEVLGRARKIARNFTAHMDAAPESAWATDGGPMTEKRLRPAPADRFEGKTHVFSLRTTLDDLRNEDHPARGGHRQITLLHREKVTQVLFSFEAGGHLDRHSAHGIVTIHVLEGRLRIEADGADHELSQGEVIILDPDVPHDVRAVERAAMLLTVHLR